MNREYIIQKSKYMLLQEFQITSPANVIGSVVNDFKGLVHGLTHPTPANDTHSKAAEHATNAADAHTKAAEHAAAAADAHAKAAEHAAAAADHAMNNQKIINSLLLMGEI